MRSAASGPLVGRVLDGKYEILERIGAGGMGTVYRALHLTLGAPRAAKVMRPELAEDPDFVERFQREARMVESLRHPHLVSLYDFGRLPEGTWYMVSELVEGETLGARSSAAARWSRPRWRACWGRWRTPWPTRTGEASSTATSLRTT